MGYDRKYGRVTTEHGDIPDDEPGVVFRGRDSQVPELLEQYRLLCEDAGSPQRHLDLIQGTLNEISAWQGENPDRVKVPDSERSRQWMGR